MTDGFTQQILEAEDFRCKAMVANDLDGLQSILDDALTFHHATGAVDNKSAYIEKMKGGRITYQSIDWPESSVTNLGDSAVMTGRMLTVVNVEGVEKHLDNRVTAVWRRADGTWTLVAFQSTPIKP